jgi:hypothetical protein
MRDRLSQAVSVDRRTVERWRVWWHERFPATPFWRVARAMFMPPVDHQHLPASLFDRFAGDDAVPYRSLVQALTDLIGGQVDVIFSTMPPAIEHVRAGKQHALGVTATMRSGALPEVPSGPEWR